MDTNQFVARIGAVVLGPYPSIYQLHRNYLEHYRERYDTGTNFTSPPAESTIRNGVAKSSSGFWSTMLHQDRGGKSLLPLPLIVQKINY